MIGAESTARVVGLRPTPPSKLELSSAHHGRRSNLCPSGLTWFKTMSKVAKGLQKLKEEVPQKDITG